MNTARNSMQNYFSKHHGYLKLICKKKKEKKVLKIHTSLELLKSIFHKIDAHMAVVEVLLMRKSI